MGGLIPAAGTVKAITRQLELTRKRTVLSDRALELIKFSNNYIKDDDENVIEYDNQFDLVYILKESDDNQDLKMSLRSIEKFCSFRKIWIVGYKPSWLKNVEYIHTEQKLHSKWKNSCLNWKTACECKDISDNFILMNDDFIAIRPIYDWEDSLNVCLGYISDEAKRWKMRSKRSRWQEGFIHAEDLLQKCMIRTDYNYESHLPMMVNKKNYLKFIETRPIKNFMMESGVLHKRTLYKNMFKDNNLPAPHKIKDVKISAGYDLTDAYFKENWISVFDDVIGNYMKFPKLNKFLDAMFPEKSNFEI